MFNIINKKKIYLKLTNDTKEICQIIVKTDLKDKFFEEQNLNVFLIYYHLLSIIYIKTKLKYGKNKAENVTKKLVYESAKRLPASYSTEMIIDISSNIITKYIAVYRNSIKCVDVSLTEELARGICKVIEKDELYFMKQECQELINELKIYIDKIIFDYENLIK